MKNKRRPSFMGGNEPRTPEVVAVKEGSLTLDIQKVVLGLKPYGDKVKEMLDLARLHEVTDGESLARAVEMELQAKKLSRAIKDETASIVAAPDAYVKGVRAHTKMWTGPLDEAVKELKKKQADHQWRIELDRRKRQAEAKRAAEDLQRKVDEEAKAAGVETVKVPDPVIPKRNKTVRTEEGTSHLRTEWKGVITDPDRVPRKYCSPDQKKINDAVKMGAREIEGVEIKEVPTSVSRRA